MLLFLWLIHVSSVHSSCNDQPCSPREGINQIRATILSGLQDYGHTSKVITERDVERAVEEAKRTVTSSFNFNWKTDEPIRAPVLTHGAMMAAKSEAAQISATSNILLQATKNLVSEFGPDAIEQLKQFDTKRFINFKRDECIEEAECNKYSLYRSFSGWCNNLDHAHYGNAFQPLKHLLPPVQENGLDSPRFLSISGRPLPSPRTVSNTLHHDLPVKSNKVSLMLMQFGQFTDHEITHSPVEQDEHGSNLNCTSCNSAREVSPSCLPIPVPFDDPFFESSQPRCLPFVRSLSGQREFGPRNQMNQITSYIDGSVIYGSTKCEAETLREGKGGRLLITAGGSHLGTLLPQTSSGNCRSSPRFPCFVAGDERNSQHVALNSLQITFLRHHNNIAKGLEQRNKHWNDEKIFQETRRIVSAQLAHILYSQWLPKIIGSQAMRNYELEPNLEGYFEGYDDSCDASISQPFATAAFRFGHSLVKRFFPRLQPNYQNTTRPVDLADTFNNMEPIYDAENGGVDSILMGLIGSPSMEFDRHVSTALRNHLFARPGQRQSGMDLISINIQRGRDHAVQGYNAHREFCGLSRVSSFFELSSEMDFSSIEALKLVYEHVEDIDLFSGLTSERPIHDGVVGPTTACLLGEQFRRLKKCDRFFYENDSPVGFSPDQLREIRRSSFASILCTIGRLQLIQPDVFLLPDDFLNTPVPCDNYHSINLNLWFDHYEEI